MISSLWTPSLEKFIVEGLYPFLYAVCLAICKYLDGLKPIVSNCLRKSWDMLPPYKFSFIYTALIWAKAFLYDKGRLDKE